MVWPVLLLLLLRPVNRKPGVWKIVIPAAIIQLFILGMEVVAPESGSGGFIVYVDEFHFVAVGVAFLWLLSGILRNMGTLLLPLELTIAMIGVGWVQILFWMGLADFTAVGHLVTYTLISVAIMLALTVSGLLCRKRYSPSKFLRIACTVLMCLSLLPLPLIGFMALPELAISGNTGMVLTALGAGSLFLLFAGFLCCVLVLMYFGIALRNPELRDRFESMIKPGSHLAPARFNGFTGVGPVGKESL